MERGINAEGWFKFDLKAGRTQLEPLFVCVLFCATCSHRLSPPSPSPVMSSTAESSPVWVAAPMTPLEMPSSPASDNGHPVQQAAVDPHIVVSPYTPAPSPQPYYAPNLEQHLRHSPAFGPYHYRGSSQSRSSSTDAVPSKDDQSDLLLSIQSTFTRLTPSNRKRILADLLASCDIEHLVFVSNIIAPRLKRDFLRELPVEIALHVLSFIDDPRVLARAACVSRFWRNLLSDEFMWKNMCDKHKFGKGMQQAYRSAMEGEMTWEAKKVMMGSTSASTDALASAMEATAMVDDARMALDPVADDADRPLLSSGASAATNTTDESTAGPSSPSTFSIRSNGTAGPSRLQIAARGVGGLSPMASARLRLPAKLEEQFSYRKYFKLAYLTGTYTYTPIVSSRYVDLSLSHHAIEANWRRGGRVLKSHTSPDDGVVTSVAMNDDWIVVGLVNHRIHVFNADTGAHVRTLVGHSQGVWCLVLVSKGGSPAAASYVRGAAASSSASTIPAFPPFNPEEEEPSLPQFGAHLKPTDVCNTSIGWGQTTSLVVSGGCDRDLRVWDVSTGYVQLLLLCFLLSFLLTYRVFLRPISFCASFRYCLHSLRGHTSTIRCLKVLDGRPIAVSGSRDSTLRVWDIFKGRCLHLLSGHTNSVRCLDVAGNIVVSGSYDCTARVCRTYLEALGTITDIHLITSVALERRYRRMSPCVRRPLSPDLCGCLRWHPCGYRQSGYHGASLVAGNWVGGRSIKC